MELSSSQQCRTSYKKRLRWIVGAVSLLSLVGLVFVFLLSFRSRDKGPIFTFPFGSDALSFDGSGRILFVVHNGSIEVQDLEKGKQIAVAGQKGEEITTLALDRNRESAYSGTAKGDLKPF